MSSDDWYRNTDWNESIEEHFYSKLKRARTQRDQYVVIQAITLVEQHPEVSLRLVDECFEARKDNFDGAGSLLARANAFIALYDLERGVTTYKEILKREREFPNLQAGTYLDYPYLVATQKIERECASALDVPDEHVDRLPFPLDYYKWHASKALTNNDGPEAKKRLMQPKLGGRAFAFIKMLASWVKSMKRSSNTCAKSARNKCRQGMLLLLAAHKE
ncbi:hypothetical protein [Alloalcanivorax xenomutans]|uniref:hypothetical protein n=1 Tax=Alloalcanivorax xenomutans TaxID=1094342 RepID=UPI003BACB42C